MLLLSLLPLMMTRQARSALPMALLHLLLAALPPAASAAERALPPTASDKAMVSPNAQQLADWVAAKGDHAGAAFIIVDKPRARVLVFDTDARLRAQSQILLGAALGDVSVPGIGTRPMALILPAERTTPAGRFVAEGGLNANGEDVVWVDYDAAVSMHRVRASNPAERRVERLASAKINDNRISYGCINVPVAFYEKFIRPIFAQRKAMVYVLPDIKSLNEVFAEVFGTSQAAPTTPRS